MIAVGSRETNDGSRDAGRREELQRTHARNTRPIRRRINPHY